MISDKDGIVGYVHGLLAYKKIIYGLLRRLRLLAKTGEGASRKDINENNVTLV